MILAASPQQAGRGNEVDLKLMAMTLLDSAVSSGMEYMAVICYHSKKDCFFFLGKKAKPKAKTNILLNKLVLQSAIHNFPRVCMLQVRCIHEESSVMT